MINTLKAKAKEASTEAAAVAKEQGGRHGASFLAHLKREAQYRGKQVKYTIFKRPEALPPPPVNLRVEKKEKKEEKKITQDDLVQPLEAKAPLKITIVSASGLAKADTFGKSDPVVTVKFMDDGEILTTHVCDNTMDPVWFPDERAVFTVNLPQRLKLPKLQIKVFDSDAPAVMGALSKSNVLGDFLGMVELQGEDVLRQKKEDITPPGCVTQVFGQTYKLQRDETVIKKADKYNKLVQGSISLEIDRKAVDEQIARKEKEKLLKAQARQAQNEAYLRMNPPSAMVMNERAVMEGGLWVPKRYADIKKGDDRHKSNYVEGGIELRSLRHLYKLSFTDCRIIARVAEPDPPSDEDSDDEMVIQRREKQRIKLRLYMTQKKPKKRMADIEETGHMVVCDSPDGYIDTLLGKHANATNFDVSLKDVPDVSQYAGMVIVKPKMESPITDEPIVFGYARFSGGAKELPGTDFALNIGDEKDRVAKMAAQKGSSAMDGLQSISYYARVAKNAWQLLMLTEEDEITYLKFKKALDLLNIIILEGRAMRIFRNCDLDGSGGIGMSEFEVALMMNDAIPKSGPDLTPLDAFYIFDLDQSGEINQREFTEVVRALGQDRSDDELLDLFVKADKDKSGVIDYKEFKQIWCHRLCTDPAAELEKRNIQAHTIKENSKLNVIGPLAKKRRQFIHFLNANLLLKDIEVEDAKMLEAFATVREKVEQIRIDARERRDERKRAKKAEQSIHSREAAREAAFRNKEQRSMQQREQRERAKKRIEEKQMQARLKAEQEQAKLREQMLISMTRKEKEEFRLKEIRRKGEDKLIMKDSNLRIIPPALYTGADAAAKLANLVFLDMSGNKLVELPESNFLFNLNTLRSFNLSHNRIMYIPAEVANCGNLEVLLIDNNDLREFPEQMEFLINLVHVDASRNKLEYIPQQIENCYPMKYLILHSNRIKELSPSIGELAQLELCNLSSNQLREIPEEFSNLTSLTKLDISNNAITHLPDDIGSLFKCEVFDMCVNQVQVLPHSFRHMANLSIMRANDNSLQEIPDCVGGWVSLMDLQMRNNKIRRISPEIGQMLSLQSLDLTINAIEALPAEFGMLTCLQDLNLRTNKLQELPPEIGALVSLQMIDLSYNNLNTELPAEFGLLRALRSVDLSHNSIIGLPMSFGALINLEELNLSHNKLPAVPRSMTHLKQLLRLNVAGNQISNFPMHICDLGYLKELDLASNTLQYLPREINKFTSLDKLDLHHNLLKALPLEFSELIETVPEMDVRQNPFPLLPNKWNYRWTEKEQYENPVGYSNAEVFEFVKDEAIFFDHADAEWEATGALHFENRLSFEEFVWGFEECGAVGVAKRMGKVPVYDEDGQYILRYEERWHERFIEHLKRFYFDSKLHGVAPRYYELDSTEIAERERIVAAGKSKRKQAADKVRQEAKEKERRMEEAYGGDLKLKIRRAEGHAIEREKRKGHVSGCSVGTLIQEVDRRVQLQEQTARNIQKKRDLDARAEMKRLQEYVRESQRGDKEGGRGGGAGGGGSTAIAAAAVTTNEKKRTMPVEIVPCWKSKPLNNESLPDRRKGALPFKAKFSQTERNYDPTTEKVGKSHQDMLALAKLV